MAYKRSRGTWNYNARTGKKIKGSWCPSIYRKKAPTSRKRLVKLVKKITMKTAEPKQKYLAISKTNVLHNNFAYRIHLNQTAQMPAQGVKDTERVGDQINVAGFKIKMLCGQQADRPNVTWRYYVFKLPKGGAAAYTYSSWFENTTGNVMIDSPNKDYVKVLASGTWRPNEAGLDASGAKEYTFFKNLWIPHKKIVKFGPADSAITHNDDDIVLLVAAYDAYGTLPTDVVGYIEALVTVYYRDP